MDYIYNPMKEETKIGYNLLGVLTTDYNTFISEIEELSNNNILKAFSLSALSVDYEYGEMKKKEKESEESEVEKEDVHYKHCYHGHLVPHSKDCHIPDGYVPPPGIVPYGCTMLPLVQCSCSNNYHYVKHFVYAGQISRDNCGVCESDSGVASDTVIDDVVDEVDPNVSLDGDLPTPEIIADPVYLKYRIEPIYKDHLDLNVLVGDVKSDILLLLTKASNDTQIVLLDFLKYIHSIELYNDTIPMNAVIRTMSYDRKKYRKINAKTRLELGEEDYNLLLNSTLVTDGIISIVSSGFIKNDFTSIYDINIKLDTDLNTAYERYVGYINELYKMVLDVRYVKIISSLVNLIDTIYNTEYMKLSYVVTYPNRTTV